MIYWIWWIMVKWIVVMKIQPSICLDDWGKTTKKSQWGWSTPGFEPGTSRMWVLCVIMEPPRSVTLSYLHFCRKTLFNLFRDVTFESCESRGDIASSIITLYSIQWSLWRHQLTPQGIALLFTPAKFTVEQNMLKIKNSLRTCFKNQPRNHSPPSYDTLRRR